MDTEEQGGEQQRLSLFPEEPDFQKKAPPVLTSPARGRNLVTRLLKKARIAWSAIMHLWISVVYHARGQALGGGKRR